MNVIIIEDESLAAEKLQSMLGELNEKIKILAILPSIQGAIRWFEENATPDLIFSDIQIADGLSFEIFKQIQPQCPIIFTTAFDQYAIEAFEVNSIDYLLKPIQPTKLANSIEKFRKLKFDPKNNLPIEDILKAMQKASGAYKSRFLVKSGQLIKTIKIEQIAYFYSKDKLNFLVTFDAKKYVIDYTLDEVTEMLDPKQFFRINRQFIIHLDAASEIHTYFKGRLKLILKPSVEEEVIVSSEKTPAFKTWLEQ
ncbi:MAG: LytTR family DNA-binding domain-containing protein [Flammeovirgaceae bacterium]